MIRSGVPAAALLGLLAAGCQATPPPEPPPPPPVVIPAPAPDPDGPPPQARPTTPIGGAVTLPPTAPR